MTTKDSEMFCRPITDAEFDLTVKNPAHNGCMCACHRVSGMYHFMPCCYPVVPIAEEVLELLKDELKKLD